MNEVILQIGDTVTKVNSYDFDTVQDGAVGIVRATDEQVISVLFEGQPYESLVPRSKLDFMYGVNEVTK